MTTELKIDNEFLDKAEDLVLAYLQECYDNLPLNVQEQQLALAATGLVPTGQDRFAENAVTGAAWVLATCWFLKLVHPKPLREAGKELYHFLDSVELDDPGSWIQTHNNVRELIHDSGYSIEDLQA